MKFVEIRNLTADQLRSLCIRNDWYTKGTAKDYENLFDRLYDEDGCHVDLTTEKLVEIAEDIWQHSKITEYTITTVLHELAQSCYTYFDMEVGHE